MKAKKITAKTLLFTLLILNSIFLARAFAEEYYSFDQCVLEVYPNGYVVVSMTVKLTNPVTAINVSLIGEPDPNYAVMVIDENLDLLSYELKNSKIEIFTLEAQTINITYVTASLTVKQKETWIIEFNSPITSIVILPKDSLIVDLNVAPKAIDVKNDLLVLTMPEGFVRIGYIIPPPYLPSPQKTNQTQTGSQQQQNQTSTVLQNQTTPAGEDKTSSTSGTTQEPSSETGGGQGQETTIVQKDQLSGYLWILFAAVGVALVIAAALLLRRKKASIEELRYEEVEILNALKALGGQAFQSDVARLVDQPTTTLWRNVRRLAEKGYVRVEKRFGRNYLILLKA